MRVYFNSELNQIYKTLLPVLFATQCCACKEGIKWEYMWHFTTGPYHGAIGKVRYVCLLCAPLKGDVLNIKDNLLGTIPPLTPGIVTSVSKPILKAAFGEPEIRTLMRGGILTLKFPGQTIELILNDIGWDLIQEALTDAENGIDHYKGLTIEVGKGIDHYKNPGIKIKVD